MSSTITPILFLGLIILAGLILFAVRKGNKKDSPSEVNPQEGISASTPPQEESNSGQALDTPSTPPGTCPACGHINPERHNFCEQCGEKLA